MDQNPIHHSQFTNHYMRCYAHKFACKQDLWSSLGTISIGQLSTLLHLHLQPINVVVFHESHWQYLS